VALVGIGPYIDWYPASTGGFHATILALGLLGGGDNGQIQLESAGGYAVGAGLGYEWWVHKRWLTTDTESAISQTNVEEPIVCSGLFGSIVFQ
jgi:hypothetical protein